VSGHRLGALSALDIRRVASRASCLTDILTVVPRGGHAECIIIQTENSASCLLDSVHHTIGITHLHWCSKDVRLAEHSHSVGVPAKGLHRRDQAAHTQSQPEPSSSQANKWHMLFEKQGFRFFLRSMEVKSELDWTRRFKDCQSHKSPHQIKLHQAISSATSSLIQ
jgi:hypothetical protein